MPSSISDSKHPALFYSKLLAGFCAVVIILLELFSYYLLQNDSGTYIRVSQQYSHGLTVHHSEPGQPVSVLMVGNSLLLYGIDVDRLRALTSQQMRIYPIFLEATGYYDWLYGLRRLFRDGARPQIVVLGVGVKEFFSDGVRPEYTPMMLLDARDALGVASDLKMDRTETTNLLLAHFSAFWDIRGIIRMEVLRHTIPHCDALLGLLKAKAALPPAPEFDAIAYSRLERLRELCQAHGAKLIILVPPAPSSEKAVRELTLASEKVGVDTLVPIDPKTLPTKYYFADEIHLNPEGAERFTSALATSLPPMAIQESTADPH